MLDDEFFTSPFYSDRVPVWPCPRCGAQSLSCEKEQFNKQLKEPIDTKNSDFSYDWVEYVFTMLLTCSVSSCGYRVACIGTGEMSQEYLDDGSGDWDWFEKFQVKHFEPPLKIFTPPVNTPRLVKKALNTSFSAFFSSSSLSLSALRSALEVLLSEMGVASVDTNGKFLPLAKRIDLLPMKSREIVEPATAIRWLGNTGAHGGNSRVRKSDVLDGYRIFEHILIDLYPNSKASIDALVIRINKARGLNR